MLYISVIAECFLVFHELETELKARTFLFAKFHTVPLSSGK